MTEKHMRYGQTDRPTDRPTDRQTDRPTDQPTDQQTDRQTDQQTDLSIKAPSRSLKNGVLNQLITCWTHGAILKLKL